MKTVGMVGLGIMGSAMSTHLLRAGWEVAGYDVAADRLASLVDRGGTACGSVGEVVNRADLVIASLPSASAALEVCEQVATHGRPGLVVVETSTLPLGVKEQCRSMLAARSLELLDCPLSGTGAQAADRDVVVYGSGRQEAFEAVRSALEAFARSVRYLGPFGRGSVMKFVANLLVAIHNAASAEAFALGIRAGLDPQLLYDTIRDGAGNSVIFEKRGSLMIKRQYRPATARVSMFVKDVDLIGQLAEQLALETPMLEATRDLYRRAVDLGLGDADAAALLDVIDPPDRSAASTPRPGEVT